MSCAFLRLPTSGRTLLFGMTSPMLLFFPVLSFIICIFMNLFFLLFKKKRTEALEFSTAFQCCVHMHDCIHFLLIPTDMEIRPSGSLCKLDAWVLTWRTCLQIIAVLNPVNQQIMVLLCLQLEPYLIYLSISRTLCLQEKLYHLHRRTSIKYSMVGTDTSSI